MMIKNTPYRYGTMTKWLHGIVAIGVFSLLIIGFIMGGFKNKHLNDFLFMIHKSIGLCILFLMIFRLIWRGLNIRPGLSHLPLWQQRASKVSHDLLYAILIVMPLSGWVMSVASASTPTFFELFSMPLPLAKNKMVAESSQQVHNFLAWVIIVIVSIHILAALKHYYINKDDVLQRMFTSSRHRLKSEPSARPTEKY